MDEAGRGFRLVRLGSELTERPTDDGIGEPGQGREGREGLGVGESGGLGGRGGGPKIADELDVPGIPGDGRLHDVEHDRAV